MAFTIIILWHYLIESFGDYLALLTTPWSVKVQNSVNVLAILVVQTLYTMRIWTLSSNLDHKCWARVLSIVLVAGYISGIILVVEIWRTIEYTEVAQYRWAIYLSLSMSTFNDFMIAAAICHLLASCGSTLSE
ncbi:hypothetical protein F5887DRAFT_1174848 [Amanita rubescens]|nr:hypothetical protein F5887DRAFT_1174848 [Amanita rubescens]